MKGVTDTIHCKYLKSVHTVCTKKAEETDFWKILQCPVQDSLKYKPMITTCILDERVVAGLRATVDFEFCEKKS